MGHRSKARRESVFAWGHSEQARSQRVYEIESRVGLPFFHKPVLLLIL